GLHPSDLIVIAGRPSMGKTALATNIAFNAARAYVPGAGPGKPAEDGAAVAFFSLEMSGEQLATRILAEQSNIPADKIRRGMISNADFNVFTQVVAQLQSVPLYTDDTAALTVAALRSRARRLKRTKDLGLIVVDYLQLMRPGSGNHRPENRVQEISEITRG